MKKQALFFSLIFITTLNTQPPSLRNVGNTCFMNASIQVLYNIQPLTELLLDKANLFKQDSLPAYYIQLINILNHKQTSDTVLKKFANKTDRLMKNDEQSKCGLDKEKSIDQQDASEFIKLLLHPLEEKNTINANINPLLNINLISRLSCPGTGPSTMHEQDYILSLPVKSSSNKELTTLNECLNEFFKKEENVEARGSKKCTKQYFIEKNPAYLIIHLKRFQHNWVKREIEKIQHPISIPFTINIASYMLRPQQNDISYNLISSVYQAGSVQAGHYWAYVNQDNQWYKCDDSNITKVSQKNVEEDTKTAYIFIYKKTDTRERDEQERRLAEQQRQQQEQRKKIEEERSLQTETSVAHSIKILEKSLNNLAREITS